MAIPLRTDFDAARLREIAAHEPGCQAGQAACRAGGDLRWIEPDGGSRDRRGEPAGGARWVLRCDTEGSQGLVDRKAPGQPSRLNAQHRAALAAMLERGPIPAVHGVVRWRTIGLCQWVWDEFEVSVSAQTLSRELRAMGYRKLSARPHHHAQAADAIEGFNKKPQPYWWRSRANTASSPTI